MLFSSLSQRLDVHLQDHQEELFCHKEHLNALRTKEKDSRVQVSNNKAEITRLEKQMRNLESELSAQRSTIEGQVRPRRTVTTPSLTDGLIDLLHSAGEPAHQPASQALTAHRRHTDRWKANIRVQDCRADRWRGGEEEVRRHAQQHPEGGRGRSHCHGNKLFSVDKCFTSTFVTLCRQNDIRGLRSKMEKSETHRRDLNNAVEELMLICDTNEKELKKLVSVEQVSHPPGPPY